MVGRSWEGGECEGGENVTADGESAVITIVRGTDRVSISDGCALRGASVATIEQSNAQRRRD